MRTYDIERFLNNAKCMKRVSPNSRLAVYKVPSHCVDLECTNCKIGYDGECGYNRMTWLKAEYIEPKITIPEGTKIDTKILVSLDGKTWGKRYYAGKIYGEHNAFSDGKTSWTAAPGQRGTWEYMKLYNESEQ